MKKTKHRTKMKLGKSERGLKIVAVVVSLIFAAAMLYPMIFAVSSAMKDNKKIYEIPPKLLPDAANSLSVVLDYSEVKGDEKELKDKMLQDNIVTMFGVSQKMQEDSIMEIKVYGVKDGETVFYSRAHQMKLQMEKDYGIYKGTAIKTKVLLHGDRYIRACDSIGYEFDMNGVSEKAPEGLGTKFSEKVAKIMDEKYQTTGELVSVGDKVKNFLNLESFKYYLQMPAYIYPESEAVQNFGFMTFVFNSIIVIGFAMVSQVILCSVCPFVLIQTVSIKLIGRSRKQRPVSSFRRRCLYFCSSKSICNSTSSHSDRCNFLEFTSFLIHMTSPFSYENTRTIILSHLMRQYFVLTVLRTKSRAGSLALSSRPQVPSAHFVLSPRC